MVFPKKHDGGKHVGFDAATYTFLATLLHIKESTMSRIWIEGGDMLSSGSKESRHIHLACQHSTQ